MLKLINYKDTYHWLLFLLIIGFVFFKLEALALPFFWDEAWVYLPAIRTMAEKGPSIMPASIDADLYTGHPLLFYFMASSWVKVLGYSLFKAHLFPLLISIALLLSTYFITFKWTNSWFSAFLAVLLTAIQPIFLAQSTFLLIEVWLSLLFIWSFYFYFNRNWWGFSIVLVLALWSKESAFCLVPAFILTALLELIYKTITLKFFVKIALGVVVLFTIGFSFFIIQKIKLGWFFFPRHANWITTADFFDKIDGSFLLIFISQGRNIIYIITLVVSIVSFGLFKNKLTKNHQIKLLAFLIITIGFVFFASINFFSPRYLFAVFPLLMVGCSICISSITKPFFSAIIFSILVIIAFINIKNSIERKFFSDVELSYTRLLKAQVQFCNYLEAKQPNGKIYAPFLMYTNLTNKYAGFIKINIKNINTNFSDSTNKYYINISNESCIELDSMINNKSVLLIKQFSNKQAKVELYKKAINE